MSILGENNNFEPTVQGTMSPLRMQMAERMPFVVRLVIRLSGGRVTSEAQAGVVVAGIAAVIVLISAIAYLSSGAPSTVDRNGNPLPIPQPSPEDVRRGAELRL